MMRPEIFPKPLMMPLSRRMSPLITSVPLFFPVKIMQFRIKVAFVPGSNLSDSSLERKFCAGRGMNLRAAQRERMAILEWL